MKFKNVFQLWFWADLILALGVTIVALFIESGDFKDFGFLLLVYFYGAIVSLPSLAAMLIFHAIYSANKSDTSNYVEVYSVVIVAINAIYMAVSYFSMHLGREFNMFYIGTTVAGFISLYIVHRRIKAKMPVTLEEKDSRDLL